MLYFNSKDFFFLINLYHLAEDKMVGNIAYVIKLLFISNGKKIYGGTKLFLCRPSSSITYVCSPHQFSSSAPCNYRQEFNSVGVNFSRPKPKF